MSTSMTGIDGYKKTLHSWALDESSLNIGMEVSVSVGQTLSCFCENK